MRLRSDLQKGAAKKQNRPTPELVEIYLLAIWSDDQPAKHDWG